MNLFGMAIQQSPLARDVRVKWLVERHPIKKRRRAWRVVRHETDKPGAYLYQDPFTGRQTLMVHPALMPGLLKATGAQQ